LSGIGSIRLPKLGAPPLLLHAELDPEHEEDEDENDEPAHLGNCNRDAKKPGQNAGVDWVTDDGIGTGGNQLVAMLKLPDAMLANAGAVCDFSLTMVSTSPSPFRRSQQVPSGNQSCQLPSKVFAACCPTIRER
jgi:hypothetical protein